MPGKHFVGKAGHLAVMGEFAWRDYNVAMPEIDIGDDIFVYRDATNQIWRVQVKTSQPTVQVNSNKFQFRVRESQITTPANPPLHFVFAMRKSVGFDFVVIEQSVLRNYRLANGMGSISTANNVIGITFTVVQHHSGPQSGRVICSGIDVTHHLNDFSAWP